MVKTLFRIRDTMISTTNPKLTHVWYIGNGSMQWADEYGPKPFETKAEAVVKIYEEAHADLCKDYTIVNDTTYVYTEADKYIHVLQIIESKLI